MSEANFVLEPFDVKHATEDQWEKFHRFRHIRHDELNPEDPIVADGEYQTRIKRPSTRMIVQRFVLARKGDPQSIAGLLYFSVFKEPDPVNQDMAVVDISIVKEVQQDDQARRVVLEKVVELVNHHDKHRIVFKTTEPGGKALIEEMGARVRSRRPEYRLGMEDVDWDLVTQWEESATRRMAKTKLEWVDTLPDDLLKDYCRLYSLALDENYAWGVQRKDGTNLLTPDVVREEAVRFKGMGGVWALAILREPNGDVSGMTELKYLPNRPTLITQFLTMVKHKYRGDGRGKWLKAATLRYVEKNFPEVETVVTTFAGGETSRLFELNERIGFKLYQEVVTADITLAGLTDYLDTKERQSK